VADDDWIETCAADFEPRVIPYKTPGELAVAVEPFTIQTEALQLIDDALVDVEEGRCDRLIISMPPQQGKSSRVTKVGALWFLLRDPSRRIAIVSFASDLAEQFGREIRGFITNNQGDEGTLDLGLRIAKDNGAVSQWKLDGHRGGVKSVGLSAGLTGRPADALFIDDPISNPEQADSLIFRNRAWNFWTHVGQTRLAPGAPVVLILTRWHPDDLAGRLLAAEDGHRWRVINIPAQAEALDPADDPLGRHQGQYMASARRNERTGLPRTDTEWEQIKIATGTRGWASLYQGRPTPAEGTIWQYPWIEANRGRTGDATHQWVRIIIGVDPAATSKDGSDETGIVVCAMDSEGVAWVVDDRSLRGSPIEWGTAVWHAVFDWAGTGIVVESNMGGDMVLTTLQASWQTAIAAYLRMHPSWQPNIAPPVTKVHANRSKRLRAESIVPMYQNGKVRHAADGTDRLAALEDQMTSWTGVGDSPDRIDALVHALTALFLPKHADAGVGAQRQQAATRRRAAGRR
jgi:hypothetical protein